jgi:hypothetical protein
MPAAPAALLDVPQLMAGGKVGLGAGNGRRLESVPAVGGDSRMAETPPPQRSRSSPRTAT